MLKKFDLDAEGLKVILDDLLAIYGSHFRKSSHLILNRTITACLQEVGLFECGCV